MSKRSRVKPFEDGGVKKDDEAATLCVIDNDTDDVTMPDIFNKICENWYLKTGLTMRNADAKPWRQRDTNRTLKVGKILDSSDIEKERKGKSSVEICKMVTSLFAMDELNCTKKMDESELEDGVTSSSSSSADFSSYFDNPADLTSMPDAGE